MATEAYVVRCWNCRNEFEALEAVWCSCDPKQPSKVCPFCLQCFCPAEDDYKRRFWDNAPPPLEEEASMLERSQERLGEILIRNQKLGTPQLLDALMFQKKTGGLLGNILMQKGWVKQADIDEALRHQGYKPLVVDQDQQSTPAPVTPTTSPQETLVHLLKLAATKGASDIHIEPVQSGLSIKFQIDGFLYKIKPLSVGVLQPLLERIHSLFKLDPAGAGAPQKARASMRIMDRDYDLLAQILPTQSGTSITIKLVDRRFFLKNFTALGLTPSDQLALVRALDKSSGLIVLSSPPFNGAITSCYSLMDYLAKSERKVVSLEPSLQWEIPYVQQIEVGPEGGLSHLSALRSVASVKPDVIFLLDLSDKETANLACQLAGSLLIIVALPAFSAAESIWRFFEFGVPLSLIGRSLSLVMNQRLVRRICTQCREGGQAADPRKLADHDITTDEARTLKLYRGAGCTVCNRIGYRRRKGIFELMAVDRQLRDVILRGPNMEEIDDAARSTGMITLRQRCLKDVRDGVTTIDEFIRWRF
jgi:type IV pilus assembly protein PilB